MTLYTIYLICAIAGGAILVLRLVLMLAGIDHGDAPDVSVEVEPATGAEGAGEVNFLSLQSIAGFFTLFGLVGMGLLQVGVHWGWSLVGGLAAGLFTGWVTTMIFLQMRRLQSEGNLVISNAVGQVGTVYLTIPEKGSGVVTVTVQGAARSLDAVSEHGQRIPTGSVVRVVGVTAGKILVVTEQAVVPS
jgi:hypothetical protein